MKLSFKFILSELDFLLDLSTQSDMSWIESDCLRAIQLSNWAFNQIRFYLISDQIILCVIHKIICAWLHNYSAFTYVFYAFIFINDRNKIIVEYTSHAAYIDYFIILTAALCLNHNLIMTEINSLLFCFRKIWSFRKHIFFKLISKIWSFLFFFFLLLMS